MLCGKEKTQLGRFCSDIMCGGDMYGNTAPACANHGPAMLVECFMPPSFLSFQPGATAKSELINTAPACDTYWCE